MLPTIVCMTHPLEVQIAMDALEPSHPGQFCSSPEEVVELLHRQAPPVGIVWEIVPERQSVLLTALRNVHAINPVLPQVFRLALGTRSVRALLDAVQLSSANVIVSVRGHDALTRDLKALLTIGQCGRSEAIIIARLSRALAHVDRAVVPTVTTAAVLLGRHPVTVGTLARALGITVPTLRVALRQEGAMEANVLLRWVFVLHCLGQAELSGRPLKAIACDAGYKRVESLTNRMARLSGMRIRQAIRAGGFLSFLEDFAQLFEAMRPQIALGAAEMGTQLDNLEPSSRARSPISALPGL